MHSNTRTRRFTNAVVVAAGLVAPALVTASPAQALTNVGTVAGVEPRCAASPYLLCLYYNGSRSAWWGTSRSQDLAGERFFADTGEGSLELVAGNANYIACDASPTSICYVFTNSGFSGPVDWLYGGRSGWLRETANENSSVRISLGA